MTTARHGLAIGRIGASTSRASLIPSASSSTSRLFSSSVPIMASSSTSAEGDLVTYDSTGHARIYRLNRPKKLNSLNHEMITSLAEKMKAWRESDLCKVVVGMGNERGFCAGGDVAQLVKDAQEKKDTGIAFFKDEFELNWLMSRLGKTYISIIDGVTMGGGAGISLPAAIRIATPRTVFAMPETGIGYAPDVGSNYYLAQLDGNIGAWLAVTGQSIHGRTVYELGIATHYVPEASLPDLIRQITHHPDPTPLNLSKMVSSYNLPPLKSSSPSSKSNPDGTSPITTEVRQFLDFAFGAETIPEIYKRLSAAADRTEELSEEVRGWAAEQKKLMEAKSPTGMAVALQGYRMATTSKRLDAVLQNDMSMATAFCGPERASEDFITGVTHLLIDKIRDRPASWEAGLDSPALKLEGDKGITKRFFTPTSAVPKLDFHPSTGTSNPKKKDSTYGKFRECGLPSQHFVRGVVTGEEAGSGAFALKEDELVERVLDRKGEMKGSARAQDMERIVRDLVGRLCNKDANGYLKWKREDKARL